MNPFDRICGLELEYGDWVEDMAKNAKTHPLYTYYLTTFNHPISKDGFLRNGARFYTDPAGLHLEYATPECVSPFEAACYHHGGDLLVQEISEKYHQKSGKNVRLFRDGFDPFNHVSYGCHENYMISQKVWPSRLESDLVPFLISRPLICGAGAINAKWDLKLSARTFFITSIVQKNTRTVEATLGGGRAIIDMRSENHVPDHYRNEFKRLHIVCGDPNVSPIATAVKVGMTKLVLMAIEEKESFHKAYFEAPMAALSYLNDAQRYFSSETERVHPRLHLPLKLLSLYDVQCIYFERVEKMLIRIGSGIPDWVTEVMNFWGDALDGISARHKISILENSKLDWIDWIHKKRISEAIIAEDREVRLDEIRAAHQMYASTDPQASLFDALVQMGAARNLFTSDQLERTLCIPSEFSRARERGYAVMQHEQGVHDLMYCNWSSCNTRDPDWAGKCSFREFRFEF